MADVEPNYSMMKILGGWGVVSGPGLFMIRSLVSGTSTAAVLGIASAMAGGAIWGTAALPFIVGSSFGFAVGSFKWYSHAFQDALIQLRRHPRLLRLHISSNFPWMPCMHEQELGWFTPERFASTWVMRSVLVVGWLSAEPALREIRAREEARLIDEYCEGQK
ncbi:hypothetical protein B0T11DRAFT_286417 [Plectosphaerella cucumerina]|uniref:Uncharacterized protein n=1 Tax=Plectosphaerella cucumerina TaxID=40658 RepID=A0A8K0X134_9PEZI|nr:hypothetical protein B0T11DRAFT_286417 [Plectosphaerella cucumerina]